MERAVALAWLGIASDSPTEEEISTAYRVAMRLNQPDNHIDNEDVRRYAEEQCKLISEAQDVLLKEYWQAGDGQTNHGNKSPHDAHNTHYGNGYHSSPIVEDEHDTEYVQQPTFHRAEGIFSSAPVLDIWKTSIAYSVAGMLTFSIVVLSMFLNPPWIIGASLHVSYSIFMFVYAVVIYPSLFTRKPKLKSNTAISFWNCAAGGFIFGAIWNGNLSKKNKGISHIVLAVLSGLNLAFMIILYWLNSIILRGMM